MTDRERERSFRWSDPRELALRGFSMTGIDFITAIKDGTLPPPPAAAMLDFEIDSVEPGRVVFSMPAHEWMTNPASVVHGGVTATLLDTVLTLAVVTMLPAGRTAQTLDLNLHFVRPVFPNGERVTAEGVALHVGSTVATAEGYVRNAAGKLIAHGTTTLAVLDAAAMATRFPGAP
jgi:uncharacterized protein (TIGR00369 family)